MGGARLTAEGMEPTVRSDNLSVVGIFEVFEKLPSLVRALTALRREARRRRPDAAVLIDFPDFHAFLARRLERDGVPLVYYVSPQVWAWRRGRANAIARRARRIITLFPFEVDIYRRLGADAVWAGHPLVDDVREGLAEPSPLPPRRAARPIPRPISRHWAPMSEAAEKLARRLDLEVIALAAPGVSAELLAGARERGIEVVATGKHALLSSADLAFVASGTATLEGALCGTPMVVVYRTSPASFVIGRRLVKVRWISLVNILAGEEVVPELLQADVDASRLEREGESLLESPERLLRMRFELERVARRLGPPGASDRAAKALLGAIGARSSDGRGTEGHGVERLA